MEIKIICKGAEDVEISKLKGLQGNLKELSKENYGKLKGQIIKHGFAFPLSIAKIKGKVIGIVDGHQRFRTVQTMIEQDGHTLPGNKLPVTWINAKSREQLGELILAAVSSYGLPVDDGLYEFCHEFNIDLQLVKTDFDIPAIDPDKFLAAFLPEDAPGATGDDPAAADAYKEQYGVIVICKDEVEQEEVFNKLTEEGYNCKVVAT